MAKNNTRTEDRKTNLSDRIFLHMVVSLTACRHGQQVLEHAGGRVVEPGVFLHDPQGPIMSVSTRRAAPLPLTLAKDGPGGSPRAHLGPQRLPFTPGRSASAVSRSYDAGGAAGAREPDAPALHLQGIDTRIQEDIGQDGDFRRRIPALDVKGWIGFGKAQFLGGLYRAFHAFALFQAGNDKIGGGVEYPGNARHPATFERLPQAEDRGPVHDRAFEKKMHAFFTGQPRKFPASESRRSFVGRDNVLASLQGGTDMGKWPAPPFSAMLNVDNSTSTS